MHPVLATPLFCMDVNFLHESKVYMAGNLETNKEALGDFGFLTVWTRKTFGRRKP